VGIDPSRYSSYPHEFSGGMRQRLAIALALALSPPLVIADEPTTSLDVAVAGQVMAELASLCEESGSALLLISHDLAMAGRWPTLMLGGGWERDMEGDEAAMVEIESTIPIFNQGRFRVDAATADLEIARIEEDRLWQRAVIDTRRALAGVAAAEHHVASLRDKTLANFDANQRIIADGVRAGERPAVELWKTEHQENHVRIQLARAQRDRALSALAFERALAGTRLPSMGLSGGGGGMGGAGSGGMGGASPAGAMPDFEFSCLGRRTGAGVLYSRGQSRFGDGYCQFRVYYHFIGSVFLCGFRVPRW
jgi:hypothetical protein